jgi:hypothetical protein
VSNNIFLLIRDLFLVLQQVLEVGERERCGSGQKEEGSVEAGKQKYIALGTVTLGTLSDVPIFM